MDSAAIPLLLAAAGLATGSFLNVCIHRLPRSRSVVWPASACTACGRPLRWYENVPVVAWLALRGRCRTCGARIPIAYLLVELAAPALFLLQYSVVGWQPLLGARLLLCAALIILFVTDLRHRLLPDAVTLTGIGAGLAAALVVEPAWWDALLAAAAGGGLLLAVARAYFLLRGEEGLGMGDVKMLAMIGAFLGWQLTFVALLLATVLGSAVGIGMLALGLADRRYPLPFGSFLAVGAVAATLAGEPLIAWYLSLF
ncbi:MAG: prepilin peptidase [Acidobacteria bacterium]|nr:prepilin peptidase [Acidobacteriota bacterium]MYI75835.1 prepilin peptidase [Acidobacteriota bacterium]